MINPVKFSVLSMAAGLMLFNTGCDKEPPEEEFDLPTITITSPVPSGKKVGETLTFTIGVTADAGLSTVSLDGTTIKTYSGTDTADILDYEYLALEEGSFTLTFTVEDALSETASDDITFTIEPGEDLGYLLLDFAGASTASEEKIIVDWDVRTLYTFNVTGSHGTSATAEVVNSQAELSFAVNNPVAEQTSKVLKIVKDVPEGFDVWTGWAHVIFNLKSVIPQETVEALPTWDAVNSELLPGSKVIKMDVYYDATVDPTYTWETLLELPAPWSSDPSRGYKIDMALGSYDPMGTTNGGHDGNFYIGYEAYLDTPNTWVTLTFDAPAEGRSNQFNGTTSDAVDCIKLLPSPGYRDTTDINPLYLKNLRIVDVE